MSCRCPWNSKKGCFFRRNLKPKPKQKVSRTHSHYQFVTFLNRLGMYSSAMSRTPDQTGVQTEGCLSIYLFIYLLSHNKRLGQMIDSSWFRGLTILSTLTSGNQHFLSIWSTTFCAWAFSSHVYHVTHHTAASLTPCTMSHEQGQHVVLTGFLHHVVVLIGISLMSTMIISYFISSSVNTSSGFHPFNVLLSCLFLIDIWGLFT